MTAVPQPDALLNDAIMIDSSAPLSSGTRLARERAVVQVDHRLTASPLYSSCADVHICELSNKNKVVRTSKEFELGLIRRHESNQTYSYPVILSFCFGAPP